MRAHQSQIGDLGCIPEAERMRLAAGRSPRDVWNAEVQAAALASVREMAYRGSAAHERGIDPFLEADREDTRRSEEGRLNGSAFPMDLRITSDCSAWIEPT